MICTLACRLRSVSMAALAACLEQEQRQEIWRAYVANTLWNIARMNAGALKLQYDCPSYGQIMDDTPQTADTRSGMEIAGDVLKLLECEVGAGGSV